MKKHNINIAKLLDNKKFVLIFSLVIAVLAWFIIAIYVDPESSAIIKDIPLTFSKDAAEQTLSVIEGADQKISVKVEGKRYRIGTLTPSDFIVTPQISSILETGEYNVKITIQKANYADEDFTIISYPKEVTLKFDHVSEKTFEIQTIAENVKAKEGYVKETPTVNPSKITLSGAKTEIDNISKCVVKYDGNDVVSDNLIVNGKLLIFDLSGNLYNPQHVTGIENKYELTIPIYKQKTVKLTPSFSNVPDGIDPSDYFDLSVTTINIRGPEAIINTIDSIPLDPVIDFRNFDIGSTHSLEVRLPSTVVISTDNLKSVTLAAKTANLTSVKLNVNQIISRNAPADYNISISSNIISNVKMVGVISDIEKLTSKDLIAYIDFQENQAVTAGTQSYVVTIYCTGNKKVWAVGNYNAVITANKK